MTFITRGLRALSPGVAVLLVAGLAHAQSLKELAGGPSISDKPIWPIIGIGALALLPLLLIMATSFVKIAVVLAIVRQGLGTTNVPPTMAITGMALILTAYIMAPTGYEVFHRGQDRLLERGVRKLSLETLEPNLAAELFDIAQAPLRVFLAKHAHQNERAFFFKVAKKARHGRDAAVMTADDYPVLLPAFVMSELKEAFIIGFLIFMPLLVVDMVIANILMALGMQMLSPSVIALPFKILVFVAVDGWHLLAKGLVLGYS